MLDDTEAYQGPLDFAPRLILILNMCNVAATYVYWSKGNWAGAVLCAAAALLVLAGSIWMERS